MKTNECCTTNTLTGQCILPGCESLKEELDDMARKERMKERGRLLYDELDDEAKEKAREWWLQDEPSYGWWQDDREWRDELAYNVGLRLDDKNSAFWTLDNGADYAINAHFEYKKGWKEYFRKGWGKGTYAKYGQPDADVFTVDRFLIDRKLDGAKGVIRFIEFVQTMDDAIREFSVKRFYRAEFNAYVHHRGGSSFSQGISDMHDYNKMYDHDVDDDFEDEAMRIVNTYTEYMLYCLEAEYEWLTSEECVAETIRANEYGFDMAGNRV